MSDICFLSATELARRIQARELSAVEVMKAHIAQIERVNPVLNAVVTFLPEVVRFPRPSFPTSSKESMLTSRLWLLQTFPI